MDESRNLRGKIIRLKREFPGLFQDEKDEDYYGLSIPDLEIVCAKVLKIIKAFSEEDRLKREYLLAISIFSNIMVDRGNTDYNGFFANVISNNPSSVQAYMILAECMVKFLSSGATMEEVQKIMLKSLYEI